MDNELIYASQDGSVENVLYWINEGSNINAKNLLGRTHLINATMLRRINVVKLLLQYDADVDIQDDYGWTALMYASNKGNLECVQRLLKAGANPLLKDRTGKTAYDIATNSKIKEILRVVMNAYRMMPLLVDAYKKSSKTRLPIDVLREVHKAF